MNTYMREAIELARKGVFAGGPFGAVVVKNGKVIGRGHNLVTSSNDPTAHAEIVAIRDACRNLDTFSLAGCDLLTSCEPCPMCLAAALWARIEKIYYGATRHDAAAAGFDDSVFYEQVCAANADRAHPMIQIMGKDAIIAFTEWLANKNRINY